MDFQTAKQLIIPEGKVKVVARKSDGAVLWKSGYQNLVPTSIDTDGSIFNDCGYMNGYRIRSSGTLGIWELSAVTGYIKVTAGDILRFKGGNWSVADVGNCIHYSGEGFATLGSFTPQPAGYGICNESNSIVTESGGVYTHTVPNHADIRYVRVSLYGSGNHGAEIIVTVNEEITV